MYGWHLLIVCSEQFLAFIRFRKRQKIHTASMCLTLQQQEYGIFLISNVAFTEALTKPIYICPQMSINLFTIKPP